MGPDFFSESSSDSIPWVKKRDGSIVPFDAAKLASSILAAHETSDSENPAFEAQELAHAVIHFLAEMTAGQIPTSEEIADTVVKVLCNMQQGPTAKVYEDFGTRRDQLRSELSIIDDARGESAATPVAGVSARKSWDKNRLVERLEQEADLDPSSARDVAASVERRLLATELSRISPGLLDELIYCELFERGLESRWWRERSLEIPASAVEAAIPRFSTQDELVHWAGKQVLSQYALREVFSRDVAGLVEEGVLHLLADSSPIQWSSASVSLGQRQTPVRSLDQAIDYLGRQLEEVASRVSSTISVDSIDAWLALVAGPDDDPSRAAGRVSKMISRILRDRSVRVIINLFGQVPSEIAGAWSGEVLFAERPSELHDRWASDFATALLASMKPQSADARRCRFDVHLDAAESCEQLELLAARWLRWSAQGLTMAFTFDRPTWTSGEGLFGPPGRSLSVVEYVGIDLPSLFDRIGPSGDESIFVRRLDMLCDSAIRLGLQKREFLRQLPGDERSLSGGAIVLCPMGLADLSRKVTGRDLAGDAASLSFAERVLRRMAHRLARESKHYRLECHVDSSPGAEAIVELAAAPGKQICSAGSIISVGRLHSAMGGGTTLVRLGATEPILDYGRVIARVARESPTCRVVMAAPAPARQLQLFE